MFTMTKINDEENGGNNLYNKNIFLNKNTIIKNKTMVNIWFYF